MIRIEMKHSEQEDWVTVAAGAAGRAGGKRGGGAGGGNVAADIP